MAKKIYGDLTVKRAIVAEVRADRGLRVATITSEETLTAMAYSWQKLLNNTSELDVNLPDAQTLSLGWEVIIENPSDSTYNLVVKDGADGAVKTIAPNEVYSLTCQDISTAAGVWRVVSMEDAGVVVASRYTEDFDATTDWGSPSNGYYTITVLGATHTRGLNPTVVVYETDSTTEEQVDLEISYDNTTGDVSLVVPETPDCRFAGRVLII